ncbi:MAG: methanol--corrinoid methyltransferase [Fidelibacterota bacterium]|nr:MAG: methanol--corrinoid methyltransferase [Candidatus Neomarinimicrobiota bacterium]
MEAIPPVDQLAISRPLDLLFGCAPKPVSCGRGVEIGTGQVLPEINFTLPPMTIEEQTWQEVRTQYTEIIQGVCQRSVDLKVPGLVVEFELLPPMTLQPKWGAEITELLVQALDEFHQKEGLRSALRVTPVDVRDKQRPPRMRSGELLESTLRSFELCAQAGADLLSIESTGGKELHDQALVQADLEAIVFALGVLTVHDMSYLWSRVVEIANREGVIPAGDTACAFANTAMILAEKGMIPRVLAALVRIGAVVRSLEAHRQGAIGPSKDCAYEGPYLKAILGVPISMEGRASACAHLSTVGNIASACCDLWSNESVQNVRLLSTEAPVVSMEHLIYDCRLMNAALAEGHDAAHSLQRWMIESDARHDPQAWILRPDVVLEISSEIVKHEHPLAATLAAIEKGLAVIRQASADGRLDLPPVEHRWLDMLSTQLETIPRDEEQLLAQVQSRYDGNVFIWEEYAPYSSRTTI